MKVRVVHIEEGEMVGQGVFESRDGNVCDLPETRGPPEDGALSAAHRRDYGDVRRAAKLICSEKGAVPYGVNGTACSNLACSGQDSVILHDEAPVSHIVISNSHAQK